MFLRRDLRHKADYYANITFKGTRLGEAFLGHGFHQRRGVALASSLACPLI